MERRRRENEVEKEKKERRENSSIVSVQDSNLGHLNTTIHTLTTDEPLELWHCGTTEP